MPQRLDFVLDNDHDEPDEGNLKIGTPKQSDSEQPEEEKKEAMLSNRFNCKHQNFASIVKQEVKEN